MGGFFGFGTSGEESKQRGNLNNVFNYGLDTSKDLTSKGSGALDAAGKDFGSAEDFFRSLIAPGRTATALRAAPAINAAKAQTDTAKREAAEMGTGRTGGDTAVNAEANANTTASIDDLINQALVGGQAIGAQGTLQAGAGRTGVAGTGLTSAANMLGLSERASGTALESGMAETKARTKLGSDLGRGLATALLLA